MNYVSKLKLIAYCSILFCCCPTLSWAHLVTFKCPDPQQLYVNSYGEYYYWEFEEWQSIPTNNFDKTQPKSFAHAEASIPSLGNSGKFMKCVYNNTTVYIVGRTAPEGKCRFPSSESHSGGDEDHLNVAIQCASPSGATTFCILSCEQKNEPEP